MHYVQLETASFYQETFWGQADKKAV